MVFEGSGYNDGHGGSHGSRTEYGDRGFGAAAAGR